MERLLYYEDAYRKEFEASVQAVDGDLVRLDQTAFYPGGGGQPADVGRLAGSGGTWAVTEVRKIEGEIWHRLEAGGPRVGESVSGSLDWDRRYALMRTHTAMHVLCGVIWRDYRARVTGGQMAPLQGRMDFEFPSMRQELVRAIEEAINREVEAARPVSTRVLPRDRRPSAYRI